MMKMIFVILFLILSSLVAFGQVSYIGYYRANFLSLDKSVSPATEFEVLPNGEVVGKIIIGDSSVSIKGTVDYSGNLEAASGDSQKKYTLKANLGNGESGKITLTDRSQSNAAGSNRSSQSYMQGNFSRINRPAKTTSGISDRDSRRRSVENPLLNNLIVDQPKPLYEKNFSVETVKVTVEKKPSFNLYHLEMMGGKEMDERGFYFSIARPQNSEQKIWKAENIRALNYVEKTGYDKKDSKYANTNRFRANYEMWLKNRNVYSGEIELISETSRQMVFKINNLKIKNEANDDFVTLNGTVYAELTY